MSRKFSLLFFTTLLFLTARVASAHASLVRADPAPNALVQAAPKQITLTFDEAIDVSFSAVQVLDPARARLDTNFISLAEDAKQIRVPLKPSGAGTYTVIWKVLSAVDGHITRGVYAFSVGAVSENVQTTTESAASATAPAAVITRWLNLFAALALVGAIFFRDFLLTRSLRAVNADESLADAAWRWLIVGALGLVISTELGRLALQANLVADAVNAQTLAQVLFDSRLGAIWLARFGIVTLLGLMLFRARARLALALSAFAFLLLTFLYYGGLGNAPALPALGNLANAFIESWNRGGALHHLVILGSPFIIFLIISAFQTEDGHRLMLRVLPLALLFSYSLTGHSAAQGDFSLGVFADWLHLVAVSFWVGGLFAFVWTLTPIWRALDAATRGVWLGALAANFSRVALVSVVVIVLTGLFSSLLQIPTIAALLESLYGQTLLVKIALFMLMLNLGAVHLLVLGRRFILTRGEADATRLFKIFRALIAGEAAIGILAIGFAGYLTLTPPARAQLAQPQNLAPSDAPAPRALILFGKPARDLNLALTISPTLASAQEFSARVTDADGKPRGDVARVIFEFTLLDEETGATRVNVDETRDGHFIARGNYFPLAGMWRIRLIARRAGAEDVAAEFPVFVGAAKTNAPNDARALDLLRQSDAQMNSLQSVRATQELNDGANAVVTTRFEYAAPDRLRYEIAGQGESIVILATQFYRESGAWTTRLRAEPLKFPDFSNAALAAGAKLGRAEKIGDVEAQIVRAASPAGDVQFAYWLDAQNRVRQFVMVAPAHFMLQNYFDYDAAIQIDAPLRAPSAPPNPASAPATQASSRLPGPITGDLQADVAIAVFVAGLAMGLRAADKSRTIKSRGLSLVAALALIAVAVFLYANAIDAAQYQYANVPIDEASAARGKSVYEENCLVCHGAQGRGDGAIAASLKVAPADLRAHAFHHDETYLIALLTRGGATMPAFGAKLSGAQMGDVIAYMRTLARGK